MRPMIGMKETKQLVLYCLSFQTSLFDERRSDGYVTYPFLYHRLPLKRASIRNAVSQMAKSGEINKLVSNQQTLINLSALGRKQLQEWAPALFPKSKAGAGFTLVLFLSSQVLKKSDLPLKKEEIRHLRDRLTRLGFVKLQRGVYCGFKDLIKEAEKIILRSGLSNYVFLISFEETQLFKAHDLSYKLLKLQYHAWSWHKFISRLNLLLKRMEPGKGLKIKANQEIKEVIKESFLRLKKMPNIPKNLVPPSWSTAGLKEKLKKLSDGLSE